VLLDQFICSYSQSPPVLLDQFICAILGPSVSIYLWYPQSPPVLLDQFICSYSQSPPVLLVVPSEFPCTVICVIIRVPS
jgi:hypothetical protein